MHGIAAFTDVIESDRAAGAAEVASQAEAGRLRKPSRAAASQNRFGYLFPALQKDPAALLPTSAGTVQALKDLGDTMREPVTDAGLNSDIPSAYAHFGQFVDHDIVLMHIEGDKLNDPDLKPLPPAAIDAIRNLRTPWLDLDNVYSDAPHAGDDALLLGAAFPTGQRPPGKGDGLFDLPRMGDSTDRRFDRIPHIGDRRDGETTIITQLHAAFLRAHNSIVKGGYGYTAARSLLRRYYQAVVAYDFLPKVADAKVVEEMLAGPWPRFDPDGDKFFMPLEFTGAAFRFGHSMVRESYVINGILLPQPLFELFNVVGGYPRLPDNWIIQWENFIGAERNAARFIDTRLARSLFAVTGLPRGHEKRLPVRTLLRGYQLGLPTGQAVACALNLRADEVLTPAEVEAVAARIPGGAQLAVLQKERRADDGTKWKLSARTPLWFYILAEAAHAREVLKRGHQLGPVGSRLVAGVLIALIRRSKDSILNTPGWPPGRDPGFKLPDLLRLARVL